MNHFQVIKQIHLLHLPTEINHYITMIYKYNQLEIKKYNSIKIKLVRHLQHYFWLNKKFNKVDKRNDSIIKTIKEYDYYS